MKKIALHFGFPQSIIGITDTENSIYKILNIDSTILFNEKRKFPKRVEAIVASHINYPKYKFDQIIFSFPGVIRPDRGKLYSVPDLDRISYIESYDHYSLKNNFRHMCDDPRDIILQTRLDTFSRSILGYKKNKYPILMIYDDDEQGSMFFLTQKEVEDFKYGAYNPDTQNIRFDKELLNLENNVDQRNVDIVKKYSKIIDTGINNIFRVLKKNSLQLNTILIISKNCDLISPDYLTSQKRHNFKLIIETIVSNDYNFPMLGCEIYPVRHSRNKLPIRRKREIKRVIIKVEYYSSNNRLLHSFTKYLNFNKHLDMALKVSSPENYYKFIFEDGEIIKTTVFDAAFYMNTSKIVREFEKV
jgi:hypothetical protein